MGGRICSNSVISFYKNEIICDQKHSKTPVNHFRLVLFYESLQIFIII
jgi:hypothetical protein